jgi:hypothetical protein
MLVDGTLSPQAEKSCVGEGKALGLEDAVIGRIVEEEIQRAGARRADVRSSEPSTQAGTNQKVQEFVSQLQDAKLDARLAQARASMAERQQHKAEDEAQLAIDKARHAQKQMRHAINREQNAAAMGKTAEAASESLEERAMAAEARARRVADESLRLAQQLAETKAEVEALKATAGGSAAGTEAAVRWQRLTVAYGVLFIAYAGGQLAKLLLSEAIKPLTDWIAGVGTKTGMGGLLGITFGGLAVMLILVHASAGARKPVFILPLAVMGALAASAALVG